MHLLGRLSAVPFALGALLTLALPLWAILARGRALPERAALLLLGAPLGAAVFELICAVQALRIDPEAKLSPAFLAWADATDVLRMVGPVLLVAAVFTALASASLRSSALAVLPGALSLVAFAQRVMHLSRLMVETTQAEKAALWFSEAPTRMAWVLATLVVCALVARTRGPEGVLVALSPLLPMLAWPAFIPGMLWAQP